MQNMLHPVVLAGGAGTRLWPLSRRAMPKQFLGMVGEKSMLQETLLRTRGLAGVAAPVVVCNQEHRFLAAEQMREIEIEPLALMLEPVGRNTAAAVTVAALHVVQHDPEGILAVFPSDHVIRDTTGFHRSLELARGLAQQGHLTTFGILPTAPETGYGYIERGAEIEAGAYAVHQFVEKPDAATAATYMASGRHLWNSGMFVLKAQVLIDEMEIFAPAVLEAARRAVAGAYQDLDFFRLDEAAFAASPNVSLDVAVMEKTRHAAVVPVDIGWSDLGSWPALWEYHDKDAQGNVTRGNVMLRDATNCYVNAERTLVAAVGVRDLIIVETADAVLVADAGRAQEVKEIVEQLRADGRTEHEVHRKVYRPWGSYEGTDRGERFQVKRLIVKPGAKLSLQRHHHRSEHWVVVTGTAQVTLDETERVVSENESIYIPIGALHRIYNPGRIPLHMIEVQSGSYLGEDDIVRIEDTYGRTERAPLEP